MQKLISFIIPSRCPGNVVNFLNNLKNTTKNPSQIEVLLKFDDDFIAETQMITDQLSQWPFDIKYIHTPRLEGAYSLAIAVEQLFFLSSDSYFVQILSDEPHFKTLHWDLILERYKHFYPDDIFRLRLSHFKFKNYASHFECVVQPDSFPIYTRKWLELTEGTGDCWGSDAYHQCVAFHLGLGSKNYTNFFSENAHYRDIPIMDIEMDGLDFGVGLTAELQRQRTRRNLKEWNRLSSFSAQEHFSYLARRIDCAIYAYSNQIKHFTLKRNTLRKSVCLLDQHNNKIIEIPYQLPRLFIFSQNIKRQIKTFPRLLLSRFKYAFSKHENAKARIEAKSIKTKNTIQAIRLAINSTINPFFWIFENKIFKKQRPGISMLYSNKPDLCIGAKKPTTQHIAWLTEQLKEQKNLQRSLQHKQFIA